MQETEGTSLGTQEEAMRRYATERGYAVEHVLTEVHTGTELWERPQLSRMREMVRAHAIDVVIAYSIDRLSRDPVHLGVIISEAEHAGVAVEFVSEPLDNTPEGQLIRFVKGYAAKVEHEKIKERTMRGKQARLRSGKLLPGSKERYGYRFNADRTAYEIDPPTAAIVRRIKDEVLAGSSLRGICARLMADGVRAPGLSKTGTWYVGTIRTMVAEPMYVGRAAGMRKTYRKDRGKVVVRYRSEEEQTPLPAGVVPPLFTAEEQAAMLGRLTSNQRYAPRNNRDPASALLRAGYVRCAVCGVAMHVRPRTHTTPPHYACTSRNGLGSPCGRQSLNLPRLDAAVWERVSEILSRPEIIAAELERLHGEQPAEADVSAVDRALTGVDRQMRTLVEQLSNVAVGSAIADVVLHRLKTLEEHKKQLEAEREAVAARRADWTTLKNRLSNLTAWCERFARRLETMDYADKRDALFMLGVAVRVWPKGHADKPADVERYQIEASIPLDVPAPGDDHVIVYSSSRGGIHNIAVRLRWADRTIGVVV